MTRSSLSMGAALITAFGVGAGVGMMVERRISKPDLEKSSASNPAHKRGEIVVQRVQNDENLISLLNRKAAVYSYSYSGGHLEFWIEHDTSGKKQELCRIATNDVVKEPPRGPLVQGRIYWVRRPADLDGKEEWTLYIQQGPTELAATSTPEGERLHTISAGAELQLRTAPNQTGRTETGGYSDLKHIPHDGTVCLEHGQVQMKTDEGKVAAIHTFRFMCQRAKGK